MKTWLGGEHVLYTYSVATVNCASADVLFVSKMTRVSEMHIWMSPHSGRPETLALSPTERSAKCFFF